MKLWLLRPFENAPEWEPRYDKAFGFVVRAATEQEARALTDGNTGDECDYKDRVNPWLDPAKSTCVELSQEGEAAVILRDFAAA